MQVCTSAESGLTRRVWPGRTLCLSGSPRKATASGRKRLWVLPACLNTGIRHRLPRCRQPQRVLRVAAGCQPHVRGPLALEVAEAERRHAGERRRGRPHLVLRALEHARDAVVRVGLAFEVVDDRLVQDRHGAYGVLEERLQRRPRPAYRHVHQNGGAMAVLAVPGHWASTRRRHLAMDTQPANRFGSHSILRAGRLRAWHGVGGVGLHQCVTLAGLQRPPSRTSLSGQPIARRCQRH